MPGNINISMFLIIWGRLVPPLTLRSLKVLATWEAALQDWGSKVSDDGNGSKERD